MSDRYIVITGWDKFQHYKGQHKPAWIKLHTDLLHRDDFLSLTPSQRFLLIGLWLEYAMSGRKIPENTAKISRRLNMKVTKDSLAALNQAGFIRFRSRPSLDKRYAREEEIREETPISPFKSNRFRGEPCPECKIGGGLHLVDCSLAKKAKAQ